MTKAWEIIATHDLCKGVFALDDCGLPTTVDSKRAVKFCALGAMMRAYASDPEAYERIHTKLVTKVSGGVTIWNDRPERTKEEVVKMLKWAEGGSGRSRKDKGART